MNKNNPSKDEIVRNEQNHFSKRDNIWQWATTKAGQKRYDIRLDLFRNYCQPGGNDIILEIGCGDGEFTRRMLGMDAIIIASDITFEVLKRAGDKKEFQQAKNISFEMDDAERLSFANDSVDIVSGISVLHHLDYQKALKECHRILKSGGEIFFTEPNLLNPITVTFFNIPFLRRAMGASPNETALIRWQVKNHLKKIGFKDVKVLNFDFLFPWIPNFLIRPVEWISKILEKIPLVKEISGSLIIYARK